MGEYVSEKISDQIKDKKSLTSFRVCSIGCGGGLCDYIWITKLKSQVPDVQLEYVGVDINESACKAAEKKLSGLDLLKVATYCQDVDESIAEENFDLVLSASSFYYMKHPDKVLEFCRKVICPKGKKSMLNFLTQDNIFALKKRDSSFLLECYSLSYIIINIPVDIAELFLIKRRLA